MRTQTRTRPTAVQAWQEKKSQKSFTMVIFTGQSHDRARFDKFDKNSNLSENFGQFHVNKNKTIKK
jgi:hypothetical protein